MPSVYITSEDVRKEMFREYWDKITSIKAISKHENRIKRKYKKPVVRFMFSKWA